MTAKEALLIIEYYSTVNEIGQDEMQLDFDKALSIITQSLTELEAIKSADGGEALKVFWKIAKGYEERAYKSQYIPDKDYEDWEKNIIDLKNYILKAQAQERELKKSDESKEQSSIDYYNEMRKYKREFEEIKSKAQAQEKELRGLKCTALNYLSCVSNDIDQSLYGLDVAKALWLLCMKGSEE